MNAYFLELINLGLRWLHVVAAIAWIGESIYFVMLDNSLRPAASPQARQRGVFGDMWAVHGGGFYHNQKYLTNPEELPLDLHWSFWKAYVTWLSGFALFAVLYLAAPGTYLANPASPWAWAARLEGWQLNVLAVLLLAGGWIVYDQLCRRISPAMQHDGRLSIAVGVMMAVVAFVSTQLFQGRAAFLITGAVMATCMSANVFFWIIPGQRRMVKALKAGLAPDPLDGKRGKQRSVHNTYFTLPVVFLMLSNHYAFTFATPYAWVVLCLFIFAGAAIRQYFVLRHLGQHKPAYPLAGMAMLALAAWMAAPAANEGMSAALSEPGAENRTARGGHDDAGMPSAVRTIVRARCVQCHAAKPSQPGFASPPLGVALDTPQQIAANAQRIKQAVATRYMPLGNITRMTDAERDVIAAWRPAP